MFEIIIQKNVIKKIINEIISNPIINIPEPSILLVLSSFGIEVKNCSITKKLHIRLILTGIKFF